MMESDTSTVLLGEDILDPYGGAFKVTRGLSTRFADRVFTTPICEATIVGLAIGLALRGMRPIAEIMFGDFITLAADQIINHAAKFPAMYNGQVAVPLVIRVPMGGRRRYGPTHSQSLERLFLGTPHLKVVSPSVFHQAGMLLKAAVLDPSPVLFVEYKTLYSQELVLDARRQTLARREIAGPDGYPVVLLKNYADDDEPDLTLITYGGISGILPQLLNSLADEEIRILSCIPSLISQLPDEWIANVVRATGRVVIVEDGIADFGWGAEMASRIYESCYAELKCPIRRVGALNAIIPASRSLEDHVLVSRDTIWKAIVEVLA
jgi:pyruvate/2-oxoglutarate/acetoin dehydrogenase E1 component